MPEANFHLALHKSGAKTPAMAALALICKKIWHEAAKPRCSGNSSKANKVKEGVAIDMPKVKSPMGKTAKKVCSKIKQVSDQEIGGGNVKPSLISGSKKLNARLAKAEKVMM